MKRLGLAIITLLAYTGAQAASEERMMMDLVTPQGVGRAIGTVTIAETVEGLEFTPDLKALPSGERGFYVHMNGSCQPVIRDGKASVAELAGDRYDPYQTDKHEGPEGVGHMGDPPSLMVNNDGNAITPVVVPWLKTFDEIKGKALMTHVGGDNTSDQPKPLGDGGACYACGAIK